MESESSEECAIGLYPVPDQSHSHASLILSAHLRPIRVTPTSANCIKFLTKANSKEMDVVHMAQHVG